MSIKLGVFLIIPFMLLKTHSSWAQEAFSKDLNEDAIMDPTAAPIGKPEKAKAKPAAKKVPTKKQTVSTSTKAMAAQSAAVGLDGATVYDVADFDGKILIQLAPGYKVVVSRKTIPGRTGLGMFYRIKYDKNKFGFVADTEMIPEFQTGAKSKQKNPVFDKVENLRERAMTGRKPVSETRYFGASLSRMNFKERYRGRLLTSDVMMYGLRYSGPGVFFEGPPLDFNLVFSPQAPDHYQKVTGTPASGLIVNADTHLLLNIYEWQNATLNGGLGVMLGYTKFRVKEGFNYVDSQHFRIGAVGELGAAYRHKKIVGRVDVKYHYESTSYLSYLFSLQHEY